MDLNLKEEMLGQSNLEKIQIEEMVQWLFRHFNKLIAFQKKTLKEKRVTKNSYYPGVYNSILISKKKI